MLVGDGVREYFIAERTVRIYEGGGPEWCAMCYCPPKYESNTMVSDHAINGVRPLVQSGGEALGSLGYQVRPIVCLDESVTTEDVPVIGPTL